jgi:hypothetical protein
MAARLPALHRTEAPAPEMAAMVRAAAMLVRSAMATRAPTAPAAEHVAQTAVMAAAAETVRMLIPVMQATAATAGAAA